MAAVSPAVRLAAVLSVLAAFLWATYYYFVLSLDPSTRPPAILAYPFLVAGAAFLVAAARAGHLRSFLALWRSPAAYLRAGLLAGMQLSVLAATYVAGPIDTSLLSLVGDVALTPLLLIAVYREGGDRARSVPFVGGLALSSLGASLTILGGGSTSPIQGLGWLVAPAVPLTVAFYFLLTARVNRAIPRDAVVGQASLAAGLMYLLLTPVLPGGIGGLVVVSPHDLLFLVALGITSFYLAPLLYFASIERAGLFLPALLMATIPLFTLVVEYVGFGVIATPVALLGVPIAVAGGFLSMQGSHPGWTPSYGASPEAERPSGEVR